MLGIETGFVTGKIKGAFFDRAAVLRAVEPGVRRSLNYAGGYVRTVMRNSIRPAPRGVYSRPGQPPRDHVGYAQRTRDRALKKAGLPTSRDVRKAINAVNKTRRRLGLRALPTGGGFAGVRHILYAFTPPYSVIVGPISNTRGFVTNLLEFGGHVTIRRADGKRERVYIAPRPYARPALEKAAQRGVLEKFRDCARAVA